MNILITGGSGYLASNLTYYLSNRDFNIVVCSRKPIQHKLNKKNIFYKLINWNSDTELQKICEDIDIIIHTAGMNSKDCTNDPIGADLCNHINTRKISQIASISRVKKFIYLSTVHVYSSKLEGTIDEKTLTENSHPYALTHKYGEIAVDDASTKSLMKTIVIRLSNVFGTQVFINNNCWDLLINNLCQEVTKHKTLTINSDGSDLRDFISIENFMKSMEIIISSDFKNNSTIINVGYGKSYSVISIANLIKEIYERKFLLEAEIINKKSVNKNDKNQFNYKIDKLRLLGYKAENNLSEGIESLLSFCHKYFSQ